MSTDNYSPATQYTFPPDPPSSMWPGCYCKMSTCSFVRKQLFDHVTLPNARLQYSSPLCLALSLRLSLLALPPTFCFPPSLPDRHVSLNRTRLAPRCASILMAEDLRIAHIASADVKSSKDRSSNIAHVARRPLPTAPRSDPRLCWKALYGIGASRLLFCTFSYLLLILTFSLHSYLPILL